MEKELIFIHKSSEVSTSEIGVGTKIWQFCVILAGARIGCNCNINCNVFIENDVVIGEGVTIKPGVQIWDGLRIGDYVFIGPNVTFTNDLNPRSKQYPEIFEKIIIDEGASIGANSTILGGVTIGKYSMIGAGSMVTKDIEPFGLYFGNPAKKKGFVTKGGIIVNEELKDNLGRNYKLIDGEPILLTINR